MRPLVRGRDSREGGEDNGQRPEDHSLFCSFRFVFFVAVVFNPEIPFVISGEETQATQTLSER